MEEGEHIDAYAHMESKVKPYGHYCAYKCPVVVFSNTVINPIAVVIKAFRTAVTFTAVL